MINKYVSFVTFVREMYRSEGFIPLHEPRFDGNEKKYLNKAIDSTFVSSVGPFVEDFESSVKDYTNVKFAIATVNGTSALHVALKLVGVVSNDEVLTQSLTFVATCNAIRYCGAEPIFIDIDSKTLSLSSNSIKCFLEKNCELRNDGCCWNKVTNKIVRACVPMHTFGMPAKIDEIIEICGKFNIYVVEDAAESLGSVYKQQHVGTFGDISALSFNGNKIITSGAGGMILTNNEKLALRAKHITTTAKIPHKWNFSHDEIGYNYRMSNINAALGMAQIESLPDYIIKKRAIAKLYQNWGLENGMQLLTEEDGSKSNYWLNTLITEDKAERDNILEYTNSNNIMTRPAWVPMHQLPMNQRCVTDELKNTLYFSERIVNVPSSVI